MSLLLIVLLFPFWIIVVVALKLTGEGYIFYFQERIGYKNRKFNIWKFATMLKDSPNMKGGIITVKNDPRLTPLGGILRKTKINELPQLVNVLKGDMSFVGPRPVMKKSFDLYPQDVQNSIYLVKPGITGIGSVVFRDEEHIITKVKENNDDPWSFYKNTIYPYKGLLELWYSNNRSLLIDVKILWYTFWVILNPKMKISSAHFNDLPNPSKELHMLQ